MASKSKITITSKQIPEFSSNISVNNVTYHVQTEDMGTKTSKIFTRIYLKGEVVFSRQSDYCNILQMEDFREKLHTLMENQHKSAIEMFTKDHTEKEKTKAQYFEEVKQLLRRKNGKSALNVLVHALEKYPGDPFLLSYYGCLLAIVENRTDEGIKICEDAIKHLDHSMPFGSEFFYPVFYLNLGRAYLKGDDKKSAITAFREGLRNEPDNHDLQWEMKKLGVRKGAAIPFLKRSNPVNKYIGMLRSKVSK